MQPLFLEHLGVADFRMGSLSVWLTQPLGMVTWLEEHAYFSNEMANLIVGPATQKLMTLYRDDPRPMRFVHDWRNGRGYGLKVRPTLVAWGLRVGRRAIASVDVLLAETSNSLMKMSATAGEAALAAAGINMRVRYDDDVVAAVVGQLRSAAAPDGQG